MYCDQITHNPQVIHDNAEAMVAVCSQCKQVEVFRKEPDGRMDTVRYMKFFKRDTLQPWNNLYYRYKSGMMNVL